LALRDPATASARPADRRTRRIVWDQPNVKILTLTTYGVPAAVIGASSTVP
jgi:hypothetical protein